MAWAAASPSPADAERSAPQRRSISSPIEQVLIGTTFRMKGRARLADARTGQEIATNPNLTVSTHGQGGIIGTLADRAIVGDPMDRLAATFAPKDWYYPRRGHPVLQCIAPAAMVHAVYDWRQLGRRIGTPGSSAADEARL
jgi:hypothetical protein